MISGNRRISESGCVLPLVYFFLRPPPAIDPSKFAWPPYPVYTTSVIFLMNSFFIVLQNVSHYFSLLFISFLRHSEEEHFRGLHLFSSRRPPCTLRALRVPHQEIIREESDLPGLGIPQQFHFSQCTAALRARCMSRLNMFTLRLACSQLMLSSRRS